MNGPTILRLENGSTRPTEMPPRSRVRRVITRSSTFALQSAHVDPEAATRARQLARARTRLPRPRGKSPRFAASVGPRDVLDPPVGHEPDESDRHVDDLCEP